VGTDGTAAVKDTCLQLEALLCHHRKAYVNSTLSYVVERLMATSEKLTSSQSGTKFTSLLALLVQRYKY
jgi:hypothetical protein